MTARTFITAHDVAKEAGVSQSAVSRAFTPGASIASPTRAKVMAAAERLGYHPNLLARSLINGRSNIVGIGVGDLSNPFFVQALELLSHALNAAGMRPLLFPANKGDRAEPSLNEILHYHLDALVLLSVNLSSTLAYECEKAHVPIVLLNRTTKDYSASSVTGDNVLGARTIAAHLLAGEHKRIAFIAGSDNSSTNLDREMAFTGYLAENGVALASREQGHFAFDAAMDAARRLLTATPRPDAIFCANDLMAIAAINVARHEFGLNVGQDISIVGYDNVDMASWPAFSLTTYSQPIAQMVNAALCTIGALRENPIQHEHHVLPGSLIVRGSTRWNFQPN